MNIKSCGAVILAGGKSRRMGTEKALLTLDSLNMIQRTGLALEDFDQILLSSQDQSLSRFYPVVTDLFPGCGPLAGLHAALCYTDKEALFTVSCDLPNFIPALPRLMLQRMPDDADVLICRDATGRLQPHCGIFRKNTLPVLEHCLRDGRYKIMDFVSLTSYEILDTSGLLPDDLFFNMNTPQDYELAQSMLRSIKAET